MCAQISKQSGQMINKAKINGDLPARCVGTFAQAGLPDGFHSAAAEIYDSEFL